MENNKFLKKLYIVAGANGVGKTTFGKVFAKEKNIKFLNADEIAMYYNKNNPEKVRIKAGKEFLKEIYKFINKNDTLILETTLSGNYLKRIIDYAKNKGYLIILLYIFIEDYKLCIARVKNRVKLGGHNIEYTDIKRRYFRSIKNFNIYRKISDIVYLIYNGDDDFEEVAIFKNNDITILNEKLFEEFNEKTRIY